MFLKSVIRDCLYLNWAFPRALLPEPPDGLRYEIASDGCSDRVFGSALLFRRERPPLGVPRAGRLLTFPQFHFRLYVLDEDGMPAVWVQRVLVPTWVAAGASLVSGFRVETARFRYPTPFALDAEQWDWQVKRKSELAVVAKRGFPTIHECPDLGSFEQIADRLRERERGYMLAGGRLRRIDLSSAPEDRLPLAATVEEGGLLRECLAISEDDWPALHSAWLCPEMPLAFAFSELGAGAFAGEGALT